MALTILVAGIGKDERARVEGAVKAALGWRGLNESWTVSLVKVGSQWSVTLGGPGEQFRNLSFGATEQELCEKITAAIDGADPTAAPTTAYVAPAPAPPVLSPVAPSRAPAAPRHQAPRYSPPIPTAVPHQRGSRDDRSTCQDCGGEFRVLYEHHPGESMVLVAVACPHCWKVNHIEIGSWAAEGREFRAEKA